MDDSHPLAGLRVLVTRPRDQAIDTVRRLEALGAEAVVFPVIAIEPPADWAPVDERISHLQDYDWLIFTSVNGVNGFFSRFERDWPVGLRIAAVGPATAAVLERCGHPANFVADEHRADALVQGLQSDASGQRYLHVRGDRARATLREELSKIGSIDEVVVYRQVDAFDGDDPAVARLQRGEIDIVLLTSSNIARSFLHGIDDGIVEQIRRSRIRLASISPLTSAAIRDCGYPIALEAKSATMDGLIAALVASK